MSRSRWKRVLSCVLMLFSVGVLAQGNTEQVEASVAPAADAQGTSSSRQVRRDLQQLMDKGIEALAPELVASTTFYPFAAILGHDNEVRLVGVTASERAASPEQMLAALVEKIRALAEQRRIRAAGYFMDYVAQRQDTGHSQPGIRVELHHRQPDAMSAFIPYSITADKKLRLLTPQYKAGKNLTFESRPHGKP